MKIFRIWLLLLLAVLLPVRGALALTMQCHGSRVLGKVEVQLSHHGHGHGHGHAQHDGHDDSASHHHQGAPAQGDAGDSGKCNLCSASCGAAALVSASVSVAQVPRESTVFAHPHAPPTGFIPDGDERPPRYI